ncbi:MAG: alpha/beta hydrolase [Acidobacteria bacterium]|nr:alpha/beta hydrolase [Acidobacteriota bacterium]
MRLAITIGVAIVGLKLLVWWLEPRMAFFPLEGVQQTPAVFKLDFEDVAIETADGETLHAWWLPAPEPRAQVIFWHGNGGNLALWLDVIAGLRRQDFSVLAVDYRGFGASTGRPSEQGLYRDADAALRVFEERLRTPGVPVIHWGRSIGAPVAAYTASKAPPDALVLESPFADVIAIIGRNPVMRFLHLFSSYRFPTSRFLEEYDGPLLVIHGDADRIIPFRAGRRVFEEARGTRKTFVPIPGADHNDLHLVNPVQYWRAIDAFVAAIEGRGAKQHPAAP